MPEDSTHSDGGDYETRTRATRPSPGSAGAKSCCDSVNALQCNFLAAIISFLRVFVPLMAAGSVRSLRMLLPRLPKSGVNQCVVSVSGEMLGPATTANMLFQHIHRWKAKKTLKRTYITWPRPQTINNALPTIKWDEVKPICGQAACVCVSACACVRVCSSGPAALELMWFTIELSSFPVALQG